jgi:hypothetical protein
MYGCTFVRVCALCMRMWRGGIGERGVPGSLPCAPYPIAVCCYPPASPSRPTPPLQNKEHMLYPTCLSSMSKCEGSTSVSQPSLGCLRAMNALEFLQHVGGDSSAAQITAAVRYQVGVGRVGCVVCSVHCVCVSMHVPWKS